MKKRKKRRIGRIILRIFLLFVLVCTVAGGLGAVGLYYYISRDLPKISTLKDYHPPIISTVYADDGRKIGEFFNERRIVVPLTDIPDSGMDLDAYLGEIEKEILIKALTRTDGVRKSAAGLLGITFRSIRYRLAKYDLGTDDGDE